MFDAPAPAVDLDAYFARIGYDGPREATLDVLRAIAFRHPDAIPFENLDVLLGRGISIVPADVDAKLIDAGRGGYCYEQNGLLKRVLQAMGFQVEGLMARVLWMAPEGAPPRPRSHQVLGVTIGGETWLADAGFGGCVLTAPLRLFSDEVQDSPHGKFRIVDTQTNGVAERQVQADLGLVGAALSGVARRMGGGRLRAGQFLHLHPPQLALHLEHDGGAHHADRPLRLEEQPLYASRRHRRGRRAARPFRR